MNYKDLSLRIKLFGTISISIALAIILVVAIIQIKAKKLATDDAEQIAMNIAQKWGMEASSYFERPLSEAICLGKIIEGGLNSDTKRLSREQANAMLKNHILQSPDFLGTSLCFEPNAFDGLDSLYKNTVGHDQTGRFIPYWTKGDGQGLLEALVQYEVEGAGDWYLIPKRTGKEVILEPYEYTIGGKPTMITSLMVPMKVNGKFVGTSGVDLSVNDIIDKYNNISLFDSGFVTLFTQSGLVLASKEKENINKKISDISDNQSYIDAVNNSQNIITEITSKIDGREYIVAGTPIKIGNTDTKWYIATYIPKSEIYAQLSSLTLLIIGLGFIVVLIVMALVWFISSSISEPLLEGVNFAQSVATGNLTATIEIDQKDEIGQLAQALGDMVFGLKKMVTNIRSGSDLLAAASLQISSSTQQLSQGSTEQASSVEEVSATMEEMVSNIAQNTMNAQEAEKISLIAQKGIKEVSDFSAKSVEASKIISGKIQIINDIAFQTNILALNAAVEAARAGAQGKGFAVVAAEVRKLAERSKVAADEIVALAKNSLKYAEGAGNLLNKTLPEIEKSTKLIQEIANASLEQNNGANQVNNAVQQLNDITQQNASTAEELASSTEELSNQAESLKELVAYFKLDAEKNTHGFDMEGSMPLIEKPTVYEKLYESKPIYEKSKEPEIIKVKAKSFTLDMSKDSEFSDDFEKY